METKTDFDMINFNVIIIGAGPAGCSVAAFLDGYRILLIDKSKLPREKPCGGILTEKCSKFINKFNLEHNVFMHPKISKVEYIDWDNNLKLEQRKNWWNVNRQNLDYFLFRICRDKVLFSPETKFLDFKQKDGGVKVLVEKQGKKYYLKTKYLVGADGAFSRVRKKISNREIPYYYAVQEKLNTKINQDTTYFIYDSEITDHYCWVIPKGDYTVIGAAIKKGYSIEEKMDLLKRKVRDKLNISGAKINSEGAPGLKPASLEDIILGQGNVFLVGEAAGLISPSSGEGVSYALMSGEKCAEAIKRNPTDTLDEYKKLCDPIISTLNEKIQKANLLINPAKRIELFNIVKSKV